MRWSCKRASKDDFAQQRRYLIQLRCLSFLRVRALHWAEQYNEWSTSRRLSLNYTFSLYFLYLFYKELARLESTSIVAFLIHPASSFPFLQSPEYLYKPEPQRPTAITNRLRITAYRLLSPKGASTESAQRKKPTKQPTNHDTA